MVACFAQTIDRGRTSRARTLVASLDPGLEPAIAMKLQELLADRFAGQSQLVRELRDGRGAALFERRENRTTAIR